MRTKITLSTLLLFALSLSFLIAQERGVVKDIDGNEYATLKIGTQEWMIENLRTTKYNDGTPINHIPNENEWIETDKGAYVVISNSKNQRIISTNGLLYNWHAVGTEKLCPKGWYVPTEDEWEGLFAYVEATYGDVAKSIASKEGWKESDVDNSPGNILSRNNTSGFNAQPAGYRKDGDGLFRLHNRVTGFWSETERSSKNALSYVMSDNSSTITARSNSKNSGFSVRCIKL